MVLFYWMIMAQWFITFRLKNIFNFLTLVTSDNTRHSMGDAKPSATILPWPPSSRSVWRTRIPICDIFLYWSTARFRMARAFSDICCIKDWGFLCFGVSDESWKNASKRDGVLGTVSKTGHTVAFLSTSFHAVLVTVHLSNCGHVTRLFKVSVLLFTRFLLILTSSFNFRIWLPGYIQVNKSVSEQLTNIMNT